MFPVFSRPVSCAVMEDTEVLRFCCELVGVGNELMIRPCGVKGRQPSASSCLSGVFARQTWKIAEISKPDRVLFFQNPSFICAITSHAGFLRSRCSSCLCTAGATVTGYCRLACRVFLANRSLGKLPPPLTRRGSCRVAVRPSLPPSCWRGMRRLSAIRSSPAGPLETLPQEFLCRIFSHLDLI